MKHVALLLLTGWLVAVDTLLIRPARWLRLPADVLWLFAMFTSVGGYAVARLFARR